MGTRDTPERVAVRTIRSRAGDTFKRLQNVRSIVAIWQPLGKAETNG